MRDLVLNIRLAQEVDIPRLNPTPDGVGLPVVRMTGNCSGRGAPKMTHEEIMALVMELDNAKGGASDETWQKLQTVGADIAAYYLEAYPRFKKWQGRVELVCGVTKYSRTKDEAFRLGVLALADKAAIVRYRACGVLAYSLRRDAIPFLETLLSHPTKDTAEHAAAAIDAINHQNHNYFIDRSHTGRGFWVIN